MGMERWYVAVADGCGLVRRVLTDPSFGWHVWSPWHFGPGRAEYRGWDNLAEFLAEVEAMNRSHPGIDRRIHTLDRRFDWLHYLLSESRRRGDFDGTDWGTKAITGSLCLPEHMRGGQGHQVRYSPPADVHEIAAGLAALTLEDIRAVYAPESMERECVYKFVADRADAAMWDLIITDLNRFRAFYSDVAANDEGVFALVT